MRNVTANQQKSLNSNYYEQDTANLGYPPTDSPELMAPDIHAKNMLQQASFFKEINIVELNKLSPFNLPAHQSQVPVKLSNKLKII